MTDAVLITATGIRLLKVPYPPPPLYRIVRSLPVRTAWPPTLPRQPERNEVDCPRISHRGEYPVVYAERV